MPMFGMGPSDPNRSVTTSRTFPLTVTASAATNVLDTSNTRRAREHIQMDPDLYRQLKAAGLLTINDQVIVTIGTESAPFTVVVLEPQTSILTIRMGTDGRARFPSAVFPCSAALSTYAPAVTDDATAQAQGLLYEYKDDNGSQTNMLVIAAHGGNIEIGTDTWAAEMKAAVIGAGKSCSTWGCKGYGSGLQDSYGKQHISTVDLNSAQFPVLSPLMSRGWTYSFAFHGQSGSARIDLGCPSSVNAFVDARITTMQADGRLSGVTIARAVGTGEIDGSDSRNLCVRLAAHSVQVEATLDVRQSATKRAALTEAFAAAYGAL